MVQQTLGILIRGDSVLLGKKKRGFGVGWWNGFGGHVEEGESAEECFRRETFEESGIILKEIEQRGHIEFHFPDKDVQVTVYSILSYVGTARGSKEIGPWRAFKFRDIPYDKMWPADRHWIPLYLKGKRFAGEVHFDKDKRVVSHNIYPATAF